MLSASLFNLNHLRIPLCCPKSERTHTTHFLINLESLHVLSLQLALVMPYRELINIFLQGWICQVYAVQLRVGFVHFFQEL